MSNMYTPSITLEGYDLYTKDTITGSPIKQATSLENINGTDPDYTNLLNEINILEQEINNISLKPISLITSVPVGTIIKGAYSINSAPSGCVLCNGGTYSKDTYPDFFNMLSIGNIRSVTLADYQTNINNTGKCVLCGYDSTGDSFRVPYIVDSDNITFNNGDVNIGKGERAGLPNISGNINSATTRSLSGAFSAGSSVGGMGGAGTMYSLYNVNFNANKSNGLYGASSTVMTSQVRYMHCIVIANTISSISSTNFVSSTDSNDPYIPTQVIYETEWVSLHNNTIYQFTHNLKTEHGLEPYEYDIELYYKAINDIPANFFTIHVLKDEYVSLGQSKRLPPNIVYSLGVRFIVGNNLIKLYSGMIGELYGHAASRNDTTYLDNGVFKLIARY